MKTKRYEHNNKQDLGLGLTLFQQLEMGLVKWTPDQPETKSVTKSQPSLGLSHTLLQETKNMSIKSLIKSSGVMDQLKSTLEASISSEAKDVDLNVQVKLSSVDKLSAKALSIGGMDGSSLAIDELLLADIVDRAVNQYSGIFQTIQHKTVDSVNHRRLVERSEAGILKGVENVAGQPMMATKTGQLEHVAGQVAKAVVNTFITYEAKNDTLKGSSESLWDYLVESSAAAVQQYFTAQLMYGSGTADNLRGIVSSDRFDLEESLKDDFVRDLDYFGATKSGALGQFGSTDTEAVENVREFLATIPSKNRGNSAVYMNPKTLPALKALADPSISNCLSFETVVMDGKKVELMEGFPIVMDDFVPLQAANSVPLIAGDINAALDFFWVGMDSVINPYTIDQVTKYQLFPRASECMKDNTSLRLFALSA
jgi:HK97 family phage major capsid protein